MQNEAYATEYNSSNLNKVECKFNIFNFGKYSLFVVI